ncbi:hypothetical protein [Xanthomonas euvesicatoria]|uniref:hypothetical protein n=1 Tax=Xanthomonas euvesicatoria TaxID=456327 RepID=UPI002FCD16AA
MARVIEFNIKGSADEVVALFNANRPADAVALLERHRQGQPEVVQESLDRYVGNQAQRSIAASTERAQTPSTAAGLQRLQSVQTTPPRFPSENEMALLADGQKYDVYASIAQLRGNAAADQALATPEQRVILGLRQENSTLDAMEDSAHPTRRRADNPATARDESRGGSGVYNDRLVVLWKDVDAPHMWLSPIAPIRSLLRNTTTMPAIREPGRWAKAAARTVDSIHLQDLKVLRGPARSKATMSTRTVCVTLDVCAKARSKCRVRSIPIPCWPGLWTAH